MLQYKHNLSMFLNYIAILNFSFYYLKVIDKILNLIFNFIQKNLYQNKNIYFIYFLVHKKYDNNEKMI